MGSFSRKRISLGKQDFPKVFRNNQRSGDNALLVLARPNHMSSSRLGLAISKKHLPRAVDRNRVKRLIRESFYQQQPFEIPLDVVVMNRSALRHSSNEKIRQSLSRHWQNVVNRIINQKK